MIVVGQQMRRQNLVSEEDLKLRLPVFEHCSRSIRRASCELVGGEISSYSVEGARAASVECCVLAGEEFDNANIGAGLGALLQERLAQGTGLSGPGLPSTYAVALFCTCLASCLLNEIPAQSCNLPDVVYSTSPPDKTQATSANLHLVLLRKISAYAR